MRYILIRTSGSFSKGEGRWKNWFMELLLLVVRLLLCVSFYSSNIVAISSLSFGK